MHITKAFDKEAYHQKVISIATDITDNNEALWHKVINYCQFYHIPAGLAPILTKLNSAYWYLLQVPHTIEKEGERYCDIATGYYTGVGENSKRVILTDVLQNAIRNVGLRSKKFNNAPKGGVKGEHVRIYF